MSRNQGNDNRFQVLNQVIEYFESFWVLALLDVYQWTDLWSLEDIKDIEDIMTAYIIAYVETNVFIS